MGSWDLTAGSGVYYMPGVDLSVLLKLWCWGGLCGAHLFKSNHVKLGLARVFLAFQVGFWLIVMIGGNIALGMLPEAQCAPGCDPSDLGDGELFCFWVPPEQCYLIEYLYS